MSDDIVLDYIEAVKAEKDALVSKLNEADKARLHAEQVLAALREEISAGDHSLYEVRAVQVSYRDEGFAAATATGFGRAVVTRPAYAVARQVVPFDNGELQNRVRDGESIIELCYLGSRSVYGIFSGAEWEAFRLWWSSVLPGKARGTK